MRKIKIKNETKNSQKIIETFFSPFQQKKMVNIEKIKSKKKKNGETIKVIKSGLLLVVVTQCGHWLSAPFNRRLNAQTTNSGQMV